MEANHQRVALCSSQSVSVVQLCFTNGKRGPSSNHSDKSSSYSDSAKLKNIFIKK